MSSSDVTRLQRWEELAAEEVNRRAAALGLRWHFGSRSVPTPPVQAYAPAPQHGHAFSMLRAVVTTAAAAEGVPRAVERIVISMRAIATKRWPEIAMRLKSAGAVLFGPAGVPTLAATLAPRASPWSPLVLLVGGVGVDRLVLHVERALQQQRLQPPVAPSVLVASTAPLEVALYAPSSIHLALGTLLGLLVLALVVFARFRQSLLSAAQCDAAKHGALTDEPVELPVTAPATDGLVPRELTVSTKQCTDEPAVEPAATPELKSEPVARDDGAKVEESPSRRRPYDNLRRIPQDEESPSRRRSYDNSRRAPQDEESPSRRRSYDNSRRLLADEEIPSGRRSYDNSRRLRHESPRTWAFEPSNTLTLRRKCAPPRDRRGNTARRAPATTPEADPTNERSTNRIRKARGGICAFGIRHDSSADVLSPEMDMRATMRASAKTNYDAPNNPSSPGSGSETSSGRRRLPERKFTGSAKQLLF